MLYYFSDESNKGNKSKSKKSPFNFFKRGKDDKNNNTTPPGKLFGHPLHDVMLDGQLPKAVMVSIHFLPLILRSFIAKVPKEKGNLQKFEKKLLLFLQELMRLVIINGPYTKGVFRKSCNVKLAKEIHQKLDEGLDCVDEETPTLVVGHLLKVSPNQSII